MRDPASLLRTIERANAPRAPRTAAMPAPRQGGQGAAAYNRLVLHRSRRDRRAQTGQKRGPSAFDAATGKPPVLGSVGRSGNISPTLNIENPS